MGPGRRRWRIVLAVALGAVVVLEVVVLVGDVSSPGGPDGSGGPAAVVVPADGGAPLGVASVHDVLRPPPAMPPVGSYVASEIAADGTVAVTQWVRSPQPVDRVRLAVTDPAGATAVAGAGATPALEARDVELHDLTGGVLARADTVSEEPREISLRPAPLGFYLTYTLTGPTLATDAPTVPGRGLARTLGMDVSFAAEAGPTVRVVHAGGPVLNAACVAAPAVGPVGAPAEDGAGEEPPQPRPCGAPTADGGWRVDLRGERRHTRLLAQVGPA